MVFFQLSAIEDKSFVFLTIVKQQKLKYSIIQSKIQSMGMSVSDLKTFQVI